MVDGGDFVSVIEAAYAAEPCELSWLEGIVSNMDTVFGSRLPIIAYVVDASDPSAFRAGTVVTRGMAEARVEETFALNRAHGPAVVRRIYATSPQVVLLSEVLPSIRPTPGARMRRLLYEVGTADVLALRGYSLDRRGVALCATLPTLRVVPRTTRATLGRVARHLATGYRLRSQRSQQPEAILSPTGRIDHAEPCAQDRRSLHELVEATNRISVARGRLRRESPERAVELWRALVSGRWSIVETVERDGKRFLLARRNELGVAHSRALTQSQAEVLALAAAGHSNGAIAYELGLSAARVSRALREGLARLGLRSRAELLAHCSEEQVR
ncbi:MAG: helix-turn-helix transcriptional regulator [Polyangiaceae bacterium]|nr:helix-turn-helix transcriptional regulator [Polyangiaceae bacterium]